ncbi:MAG: hypothetical protein GY928_26880 [Colwellia sp.]|nr:hypothetical protein [Colwellia sp.]
MNENKNISELISLLEINQGKVSKDVKKDELKLNAIKDLSQKDEITFEDEVISKYIVIKTIKGTVKHFKDSGITTKSGLAITQSYVSELINGTSNKTNRVLLRMAKEILNTNKSAAKQRGRYM